MTEERSGRPTADEYPSYYERYVTLVTGADLLHALHTEGESCVAFYTQIAEQASLGRYAPGKWSVREVLGHVVDVERVMAYRALRFARADRTALPGFDDAAWVANAGFDRRPLASLLEEFRTVRAATLSLFQSFAASEWTLRGTANGQETSVRGLGFIIAGHEIHHRRLVESRYLPVVSPPAT